MIFVRSKPLVDPNATPMRRRSRFDFSLIGWAYCAMMMFMGFAAVKSGANLLYGIFGLMIGILLVADMLNRKVLKKMGVHRQLPDHAMVGVPVQIVYQFTNRKKFWPSFSITASELDGVDAFTKQPHCYMLHTAPAMTAAVPTEVIPKRRGVYQFERFQISTSFPFGFVKRAQTGRQADQLLVFPAIGRVDRALLELCRAAEQSGAPVRPQQGGLDEFFGVKEHRPGDNPRFIYWKRSARTAATGVLVAREMTHVSPPKLILLVDTWLTDNSPEGKALVEKAIAIAGSLAAAAIDDDLSVGLLSWSDGWKRMDASRGKRHGADLLSALARLPLNVTQDTATLVEQGFNQTRGGATAVLITPRALTAGKIPRQSGLLVVPADAPETDRWFHFDPAIDFAKCAPWNHATTITRSPAISDSDGSKYGGVKRRRSNLKSGAAPK